MWVWLRRALGKDGLKGQAQPRIADAICQAADSVYTVGEPFFSSGRDENGLDLRLRARVEIVAYFLHWASRSMHMFDCAEIFDSSVEKVLVDLRRYLARDHHQELREFGLPQFERYFLETLGEREADYAFQYPESDDGVEFLTMLACRLDDHLMPTMPVGYRLDGTVHDPIIRATLEVMMRGWAERLGIPD